MTPHLPPAVRPPATPPTGSLFAREYWLVVVLAMTLTAVWVGWPAFSGAAPLDTPRLVITCLLAGVVSLLALTVIEMRLAPWRFMQ